MDYVKANLSNENVVLLDVRTKHEFEGHAGKTERKGHIPGAICFYYEWVLDLDDNLKAKKDIIKIAKANEFFPDKEIIIYIKINSSPNQNHNPKHRYLSFDLNQISYIRSFNIKTFLSKVIQSSTMWTQL